MKIIRIAIANKIAKSPVERIVCGNSDYCIEFAFDAEWDKETVKTARFVWNGKFEDKVFTGNTVSAPIIEDATALSVGVFAGELRTTTPALVGCDKSILCGGGVPAEPSEDVYSQIITLCNDAIDTAKSVEDRANNGDFNGKDGEDGEDYVLTEADKAEIVSMVMAEIPDGSEVSY